MLSPVFFFFCMKALEGVLEDASPALNDGSAFLFLLPPESFCVSVFVFFRFT